MTPILCTKVFTSAFKSTNQVAHDELPTGAKNVFLYIGMDELFHDVTQSVYCGRACCIGKQLVPDDASKGLK